MFENYEEVGLGKEDINIVAISKEWITYDIPTSIRSYVLGGKFKVRFKNGILQDLVSPKEKIDLNRDTKPEFDRYEWVTYWYPLGKIIDFKRKYRKPYNLLSKCGRYVLIWTTHSFGDSEGAWINFYQQKVSL